MDVDARNFATARDFILKEKLIQKATHISFDLQFTGIKFPNNERDRPFYLPYEKYMKMAQVVRKYSIIQVGLTFFVQQKQLIAYPFNFYVFPRESPFSDPVVGLQAGCVQFNTEQDMDWNRWIRHGITYMKLSDKKQICEEQAKGKTYLELIGFMDADSRAATTDIVEQLRDIDEATFSFQISKSYAYAVRKAIEKYIGETEENLLVEMERWDRKDADKQTTKLVITRISPEKRHSLLQQKQEQLFGFTLLFQEIWISEKTLIGHNCFFDLLFLYESFVEPLPVEYAEFKRNFLASKLGIIDTKFIAQSIDDEMFTSGTSLKELYGHIHGEANTAVVLPVEFQRYDLAKPNLHQAGFDSYLTGWIYFQLRSRMKEKQYRGRVNLNMSYFHIRLDSVYDAVNENAIIFCVEVAPHDRFVKLEELRKMKQSEIKAVKQLLKKQEVLKYVTIQEGLKELFIELRSVKHRNMVSAALVSCVQTGMLTKISGLATYLHSRILKDSIDRRET